MGILNHDVMRLMLAQETIKVGTVICDYTTPGEYEVIIPEDGIYEIYCIAPGGEAISSNNFWSHTTGEK